MRKSLPAAAMVLARAQLQAGNGLAASVALASGTHDQRRVVGDSLAVTELPNVNIISRFDVKEFCCRRLSYVLRKVVSEHQFDAGVRSSLRGIHGCCV